MFVTCAEHINTHINDTVYLHDLSNRKLFSYFPKVVLVICYVSVYTVNIIGNISIWMAILSRKTLQTPMNYFLLNLSLTHIISGSNSVFFAIVTDTGSIASSQTSLDALCAYSEGLCVYFISAGVYLFTLCAISINRYVVIKYPTRHELRMKKKGIVVYSIFIWLICIGLLFPSFISFRYEKHVRLCLRNWKHIKYPFIYRIALLLFSLILPLTCLIISFAAILWKRLHDSGLFSNRTVIARNRNLQKAEKLLATSIVAFLITWLPFFLYWLLWTIGYFPGCDGAVEGMKWMRVTLLFSTINGAIDPVIYTAGNRHLRMAIAYQFRKFLSLPIEKSNFPNRVVFTRNQAIVRKDEYKK
ncbi:adenosine receptor A2b-like [Hydractinia symbiolongicarpus]|uniref:adenosine receptor A2b-like n=1 Tax=Hydractinia symbiolongicarpus TaxID=13093 RepID=UPI00254BF7AA|nr:adenosine receptor A2b-like [Hydractinia symbiolongicarpus]